MITLQISRKYLTQKKMTESEKRSSLLRCEIITVVKSFMKPAPCVVAMQSTRASVDDLKTFFPLSPRLRTNKLERL
jgi:hypothetical protein